MTEFNAKNLDTHFAESAVSSLLAVETELTRQEISKLSKQIVMKVVQNLKPRSGNPVL